MNKPSRLAVLVALGVVSTARAESRGPGLRLSVEGGYVLLRQAAPAVSNLTGFIGLAEALVDADFAGGRIGAGVGLQGLRAAGGEAGVHQSSVAYGGAADVQYLYSIVPAFGFGVLWRTLFGLGTHLQQGDDKVFQIDTALGVALHARHALGALGLSYQLNALADVGRPRYRGLLLSGSIGVQLDGLFSQPEQQICPPAPVGPPPAPPPSAAECPPCVQATQMPASPPISKAEPVAQTELGADVLIFQLNEVELRPGPKEFVRNVGTTLAQQANDWSNVIVRGRAEVNELALSPQLPQQRAEAIRAALVAQGVPADKVAVDHNAATGSTSASNQSAEIVVVANAKQNVAPALKKVVRTWENSTVVLVNRKLTFERSGAQLSPDGAAILAKIAGIAKQHQDLWQRMVVYGHTDITGRPEFNVRLAIERARNAAALARKVGIPTERLESVGMSSAKLLDTNDASSYRNRRIEIELTGVKDRAALLRLLNFDNDATGPAG